MLSSSSLHLVEDRRRTLLAAADAHRAATRRIDVGTARRAGLLARVAGAWASARARQPNRPAPARPLAARPSRS